MASRPFDQTWVLFIASKDERLLHQIIEQQRGSRLSQYRVNDVTRDDFKTLLGELRDTARNPEWAYVDLEYEIWMTKIG